MGYFTQTTGRPVHVEMPEWLLTSSAYFYLSPGYPRVAQYDYPWTPWATPQRVFLHRNGARWSALDSRGQLVPRHGEYWMCSMCLVVEGGQGGDPCDEGMGVSGALRGSICCCRTRGVLLIRTTLILHTDLCQVFRVSCSESVYCANAFRMITIRYSSHNRAHAHDLHSSHKSHLLRWTRKWSSCHEVL